MVNNLINHVNQTRLQLNLLVYVLISFLSIIGRFVALQVDKSIVNNLVNHINQISDLLSNDDVFSENRIPPRMKYKTWSKHFVFSSIKKWMDYNNWFSNFFFWISNFWKKYHIKSLTFHKLHFWSFNMSAMCSASMSWI